MFFQLPRVSVMGIAQHPDAQITGAEHQSQQKTSRRVFFYRRMNIAADRIALGPNRIYGIKVLNRDIPHRFPADLHDFFDGFSAVAFVVQRQHVGVGVIVVTVCRGHAEIRQLRRFD